ncbi:adenosine deaminase [Silvanigrella paludirubra]|uniref:Adenine deaminase n=1 Tax=Silvanigrella paludirubra TaxID=2499159 RepID=A0A6N6VTU1_9BACT|nr:adenosine deaminase [Silvanigrella paludirubra]KAB8039603.1 adenosine deaminase [Silvanigrella paludirubra]
MLEELRKIPKAELHIHIEGSLEPELLFSIAERNKIELPYKSIDEVRQLYQFHNLQSFLDIYYQATNVLKLKKDFYELTYSYLERVHRDGVCHVEIFFDPQSHTSRGVLFSDVIEGIHEALEQGKKDFNISYFIIMSFLRHLSEEDALEILEQSLPYKHLIKAVGLDSSEQGNPPSKFKTVFSKCKDLGFLTVAHAGEEGPPEYIWEALNLLNVSRIDHGVRSIEDKKLIEQIIENKIPLTVCPLSNIKLKVYEDLKQHHIKELFDLGVRVTINSDDPAYFGGYILENYIQCKNSLGFTFKDLCKISKYSIEASFLSQVEKDRLLTEIDEVESSYLI